MEQENAKAIEIPTQQNIYLFLADLKMCYIESSFIAKTIFVFFPLGFNGIFCIEVCLSRENEAKYGPR